MQVGARWAYTMDMGAFDDLFKVVHEFKQVGKELTDLGKEAAGTVIGFGEEAKKTVTGVVDEAKEANDEVRKILKGESEKEE